MKVIQIYTLLCFDFDFKASRICFNSFQIKKLFMQNLFLQFAGFTQRVDPKLVTRIKELVAEGVRNVSEMKRHLLISVKNDICPDQDIPKTNRRFFPLDKDIKNNMDIAINSLRYCQHKAKFLTYFSSYKIMLNFF